MNYFEISKNSINFLSLTSITVIEFEYLYSHFETAWDKYYKYHTLEGGFRKHPLYSEHKNALLKGTEQKLFFMLVYMKNNPLQTFQGSCFGISQSKVSKIYRTLLSILDISLKKMGLSPCRDSGELKKVLSEHPQKIFAYDGTEFIIQRNDDQEAQEVEYSGKKHGHRQKNLVLCDMSQTIHYFSPTEVGSMHDKAMADEYPLSLPIGSVIKQDLGFVGHQPQNCLIEQPFKKPKNGQLSFSQAIYNKIFNSTRVVVEHVNSGFKRLRIIKDVIRVHADEIRDKIRVVACALHNLRVLSIDPIRKYQTTSKNSPYIQKLSE